MRGSLTLFSILIVIAIAVRMGDARKAKPIANGVACELLPTRHLAVDVMIDGHGPFKMIFDTGSPANLLSTKVAKECQLFEPKRKKPERAAGTFPGQVLLNSVTIGTARADNVPAMVADHPTLKALEAQTGPIEGLIGYPFFARFKTSIDYSQLQLTFEPNNYQPEDVLQGMMRSMFERGNKSIQTIFPAAQWGLEVIKDDAEPGVTITKIYGGTPAAIAGLREGDRLITLDGRWTDSVEDCFAAGAEIPAGQTVIAVIHRGGQEMSLSVTPRVGL